MNKITPHSTFEKFKNEVIEFFPNCEIISENIVNNIDGSISFISEIIVNDSSAQKICLTINPSTPAIIEYRRNEIKLDELSRLFDLIKSRFDS